VERRRPLSPDELPPELYGHDEDLGSGGAKVPHGGPKVQRAGEKNEWAPFAIVYLVKFEGPNLRAPAGAETYKSITQK
jgi:hypothetical protein